MIPQTVNHLPVHAAIRLTSAPGEINEQYDVVCADRDGTYVVWGVWITSNDEVHASNGHYQLDWERALAVLVDRAINSRVKLYNKHEEN